MEIAILVWWGGENGDSDPSVMGMGGGELLYMSQKPFKILLVDILTGSYLIVSGHFCLNYNSDAKLIFLLSFRL